MTKKEKVLFIILAVVLFLIIAAAASFIPTLWLKESGMKELRGEWVTLYYGAEKSAAEDVYNTAEQRAKQLAEKLGFSQKQDINIYVYDSQFTFQTKKYGLIGAMLGLDWYIGDNRGTNVLLTSPANPGKAHSYDDCKNAVLHEMVHAYNYVINRDMPLWLNEGVALYLSNGNPPEDLYNTSNVPSFEDIQTKDPIKFSNMGGYDFACTYVEYLEKTYGWDKVLKHMQTLDTMQAYGTSELDIYNGWLKFLKENY